MKSHSFKASQYAFAAIGLTLFYLLFKDSGWLGDKWLHTMMEAVSTVLATMVGVLALVRYYAKREALFQMIGAAFLGTAALDGYHTIVTSPAMLDLFPSDLSPLAAWSWIASRIFLSAMLLMSWVYWKRQQKLGPAGNFQDFHIFSATSMLTVLIGLFFAFIPLPSAYIEIGAIGRPAEFLPGLIFVATLIGYYKKKGWRNDPFEHWLVLALVVNAISQLVYIPFCKTMFDFQFDMAHILKALSYCFVLIGLMVNVFKTFQSSANGETIPSTRSEDFEADEIFQSFSKGMKIRMGLTPKLILGTSFVVIFAAGTIGLLSYKNYVTSVEIGERSNLESQATQLKSLISNRLDGLKNDTRFLANTPPIQGIIRATNEDSYDTAGLSSMDQWKNRLQTIFTGFLNTHSEYSQIRYIGINQNGLELIRVERTDNKILVVDDSKLQEKGNRTYFADGIKASEHSVYLSDIDLNRENGEIVEPFQPTVRGVNPIYGEDGQLFGAIVINMDLRKVFAQLAHLNANGSSVFITNDKGDYVLHSDSNRTFGTDRGHTIGINTDYPNALATLNNTTDVMVSDELESNGNEVAIAFARIHLDPDKDGRSIGIAYTTDVRQVIKESPINPTVALISGIIALGVALVFAWVFSISIANPLRYISWAAQSYGTTGKLVPLPLHGNGEIGVLAESLHKLHTQTEDRAAELKDALLEREETNRKLESALENANQATEAKSQFLATMSHEIRTPMNGLIGILDLMEADLPASQKGQLEIAQNSGKELLILINDILDFSKIEAGKLELESIEFDIIATVGEIASLHSQNAFEKEIDLIFTPTVNAAKTIIGDPHRLRQVISNLTSNAIKFTNSGEVEISVDITSFEENSPILEIRIRDTGIGLSEKDTNKLFEAFNQANSSTTREYGGTGLGLSISKLIIDKMEGEIGVNSVEGVGSTFWIKIPTRFAEQQIQLSEPIETLQLKKVLIIDNNRRRSENVAQWISKWGLIWEQAASIEEVVKRTKATLSSEDYDFVLIDWARYESHRSYWNKILKNTKQIDNSRLIIAGPVKLANTLSNDRSPVSFLPKPIVPHTLVRAFVNEKNDIARNLNSPETDLAQTAVDLSGSNILLVEDNATNRLIASSILKRIHGNDPDIACNGVEALEKLKSNKYDLVIMDCMMPKMDGMEATKHVREGHTLNANTNVPIIALTANASSDDRDHCIAIGMSDHVSKPVQHKELNLVLKKWYSKRHEPV